MSTFAVAAFYDDRLAASAGRVDAVVWVRAAGLDAGADVSLRVWTPAGAELVALRAVAPGSDDLLTRAVRLDDRTAQFAAGHWSDGVHEFELAVVLPARAAGEQMLAARVGVVLGGDLVGHALIAVTWTDMAPSGATARPPAADGGIRADASPSAGAGSSRTADAAAEVPTGPSPHRAQPEAVHPANAEPCRGCGAQPEQSDRFCEACGRRLR